MPGRAAMRWVSPALLVLGALAALWSPLVAAAHVEGAERPHTTIRLPPAPNITYVEAVDAAEPPSKRSEYTRAARRRGQSVYLPSPSKSAALDVGVAVPAADFAPFDLVANGSARTTRKGTRVFSATFEDPGAAFTTLIIEGSLPRGGRLLVYTPQAASGDAGPRRGSALWLECRKECEAFSWTDLPERAVEGDRRPFKVATRPFHGTEVAVQYVQPNTTADVGRIVVTGVIQGFIDPAHDDAPEDAVGKDSAHKASTPTQLGWEEEDEDVEAVAPIRAPRAVAGLGRRHRVLLDHAGVSGVGVDVFEVEGLRKKADAAPCNKDVKCHEAGYEDIKQAVVKIFANSPGKSAVCTGTLLNTPSGRNFVATAAHCSEPGDDGSLWAFLFGYEAPTCGKRSGARARDYVHGGSILFREETTDFMIVEILGPIPARFNAYYAGWDGTPNLAAPPAAVCIHHPQGAAKMISIDNEEPYGAEPDRPGTVWSSDVWGHRDFDWNRNGGMGPPSDVYVKANWVVDSWDLGTTEPGSSGSPLIDPRSKRVIGVLYGGTASCPTGTGFDMYRKFSRGLRAGAIEVLGWGVEGEEYNTLVSFPGSFVPGSGSDLIGARGNLPRAPDASRAASEGATSLALAVAALFLAALLA
ncbi:unnamed protein product [Pedinophyceae sp. YPF-701]|nr:unnamed protein product [Pedinophyceae sp. YPF-701]